jgi:signal transduction histidine kinase
MALAPDDLRHIIALSDLNDEHLQWLIDHSEYVEFSDGEIIAKYGEPAEVMWIGIEGKVAFYLYVNGRQVYYFTFENGSATGGVGGLLPYSRLKTYPGYSYALGDVKLLRLHKKHFPELEAMNPDFIQRLIGYMTERARAFATTQLQHEKVNALGNLAAGIAHEMNNPAAAITAIAEELNRRLNSNFTLTQQLLETNISGDHLRLIQSKVEEKTALPPTIKLSTLDKMAIEDDLEEWLEERGVHEREIAETFAETGFSTEDLDAIFTDIGEEAFPKIMPWLENLISSRKIIHDLSEASGRISDLVVSIKSHVHMDRTSDLQLTNLHRDIDNTITLLGFKLRAKNINVVKKFCSDLKEIPAFVGELNQVWTNIIDNAIFALPQNGTLTILTSCDEREVNVTIQDNGPGIPADIQSRIFEPFFTTKKVGEGSGIGLDTVNRVVKNHHGSIRLESEPGNTRFVVHLPIVQAEA